MPNPLLDALGFVGNVLDTPGSVARGLLAGEPSRAIGGVFDPSQRVYGRETLQNWGLQSPGDQSWGGFFAGLGTEIATDPLNLIPGALALKSLPKTMAARRSAIANNALRRDLLAARAMPEEIVGKTLAVDELGRPRTMYHGTATLDDLPAAGDDLITHPRTTDYMHPKGLYWSTDPSDAVYYRDQAAETFPLRWTDNPEMMARGPRPKILESYLDVREPMEFLSEAGLPNRGAGRTYQELSQMHGPDVALDLMRGRGYDAAYFPLPGNEFHIAAFDPSQMYAPMIAPAAQRVPSYNPLLASLGGYNLGARGGQYG